jgi:hypothetical protein
MSSTAATSPKQPIKTSKVSGRRALHFSALAEIQADAERLVAGPTRQLGNWDLGTALSHLARTMKMSLDGATWKAPFLLRMIVPLFKNRMLRGKMKPGFKMPGYAAADLMPEAPISSEQGLSELKTQIERLNREPQRSPSPFFGPMTREEWNQLHCRHAELHLSFFVPD